MPDPTPLPTELRIAREELDNVRILAESRRHTIRKLTLHGQRASTLLGEYANIARALGLKEKEDEILAAKDALSDPDAPTPAEE